MEINYEPKGTIETAKDGQSIPPPPD